MKLGLLSWAVAGVVCMTAVSARAATTVSLLTDTGSIQLQTFAPPGITSATLTNPYGAPPLPTVVVIPNGVSLSFVVTADFLASATGTSGGKKSTMDGQIDLLIAFDTFQHLTVSLHEDGIYSKTGAGTVNVDGFLKAFEADSGSPLESITSNFPAENYDASGLWSLNNQVTGFVGSYKKYHVTIDNTLIATALAAQDGAYLAKKDFVLTFTTDGSGGGPNVPEPASLGVLALGGLALMARRRR